jgi:purine-binding chemotaxis protein CheW
VTRDGSAGSPERELLEMRAARLAEPLPDDQVHRELIELVLFRLGGERYGIESRHVREVFRARECTPVPCTPPFVLGVVNVRGRITSVLDLRKLFDLPGAEGEDTLPVLILSSGEMEFGVAADEVLGVARVSPADLQADLPTVGGARAEYLKGVRADRLIVLDGGRMLSDPGLVVQEEVPV